MPQAQNDSTCPQCGCVVIVSEDERKRTFACGETVTHVGHDGYATDYACSHVPENLRLSLIHI